MKVEARSSFITFLVFCIGCAVGFFGYQRSDEHKLVMATLHKISSFQQYIDLQLSNEIRDYRKKR